VNFIGRAGQSFDGPSGHIQVRFCPGIGPFGGNGPLEAFLLLILFVIIIAALALLITLFIRRSRFAHRFAGAPGAGSPSYWHPSPSSDALRILSERFARGEIDSDEYRERRDLLNGQS
jgi:putative membrane protein